MQKPRNKGFTLVEILIVVVILGILAAIVVPQFTNASQQAVKGALASQLQTINAQVELYRVQETGTLPHDDADSPLGGADHSGWGVLVEEDFLKDEPNNGYTRSTAVEVDAYEGDPVTDGTAAGWGYDSNSGEVFACGYNNATNLLANEQDEDGNDYVALDPFDAGGGG